jgi:tetratricopeptide (TPR) repeat protein
MARSVQLALASFTSALELNPRSSRTYRERARAKGMGGDLDGAIADLQEGLRISPRHWETLRQLAELKAELGEVGEARALLEQAAAAEPKNVQPKLALAVLAYQQENRAKEAVAQLQGLLRDPDALEDATAASVYTHLAAAQRAAGMPRAEDSARLALTRVPNHAPAHLQLLLVLLERGDQAEALSHALALQGRMGDAALELVLLGMAQWSAKQLPAAVASFRGASALDERRVDASLWAATAEAYQDKREEAKRALSDLTQRDPDRSSPPAPDPSFVLLPGDTLLGVSRLLGAQEQRDPDVRLLLGDALVRYQQGAMKDAIQRLDKVLEQDDTHAVALSLKALAVLKSSPHGSEECRNLASAAVRGRRGLALAHYALGRCQVAAGNAAEAQRSFQEAVALSPGMSSAEVALGMLEPPTTAQARLREVLQRDASYIAARRALFARLHAGGRP